MISRRAFLTGSVTLLAAPHAAAAEQAGKVYRVGLLLLNGKRESVEREQGWRLSACDVELARVRFLASEPVLDQTTVERALESADALAAETGADLYRRMVELERERLARTVSALRR